MEGQFPKSADDGDIQATAKTLLEQGVTVEAKSNKEVGTVSIS